MRYGMLCWVGVGYVGEHVQCECAQHANVCAARKCARSMGRHRSSPTTHSPAERVAASKRMRVVEEAMAVLLGWVGVGVRVEVAGIEVARLTFSSATACNRCGHSSCATSPPSRCRCLTRIGMLTTARSSAPPAGRGRGRGPSCWCRRADAQRGPAPRRRAPLLPAPPCRVPLRQLASRWMARFRTLYLSCHLLDSIQ